jgi:hypothetical protein
MEFEMGPEAARPRTELPEIVKDYVSQGFLGAQRRGWPAAMTPMPGLDGFCDAVDSGSHVYLKRAALNRSLFGSPASHRKRLAD